MRKYECQIYKKEKSQNNNAVALSLRMPLSRNRK